MVLSYGCFCFQGFRCWGSYIAFAFYGLNALGSLLLGLVCFLLARYTGLLWLVGQLGWAVFLALVHVHVKLPV